MFNCTPSLLNGSTFSTTNTSSNGTGAGHPTSHDLVGYVAAVLTTNFIGLPINVLILLAIILYPPLRKSSSGPLLVQCAAIDVLFSLVVGPMTSLVRFFGMSYHYPPWFCHVVFTLFVHTAHPASMYAACMIALQRLSATIFPHEHKNVSDRKVIIAMLIVPWVMALGSVAFPLASYQLHTVQSAATGGCVLTTATSSSIPSVVFAFVVTYLPTVVTGIAYVVLLIKAVGLLRVEKRKPVVSKARVDALQRRLEIHVALVLSFVWHCLTIYPFTLVVIIYPKILMSSSPTQLALGAMAIGYCTLNPAFYLLSSRLFQQGVLFVLRKLCPFRRTQRSRSSSQVNEIHPAANDVPVSNGMLAVVEMAIKSAEHSRGLKD